MLTLSPTLTYQQQLTVKVNELQQIMKDFVTPSLEIFPSSPQHYRMRAEFRIWHQADELYHIMFDPQSKHPVRLEQLPAASQLINQLMPVMMEQLHHYPLLRQRLFQIDYLTTTQQQALITLLYHRPLDEQWRQQTSQLRDYLRQQGFDIHLIGRARKTKICLDNDYLDEKLVINGRPFIYRQIENCFTQPNAEISMKMLTWAQEVTANSQGDLLELYCGNGNFSLALAKNFRRVLATEIAGSSVAAAQYNIQANHIDNVTILRLSAEEFSQALMKVRPFRRLAHIDLDSYHCETILVDPPRSGLDPQTLNLVQNYPHIVYISCNPHTLAENLHQLTQTHQIKHFALFDQFPYTQHMETAVYLSRLS